MNDTPLTVYPVTIETDEDLEVPEFGEESICIKIDKIGDADPNKRTTVSTSSPSRPRTGGFGAILSAIRIAKWMAKAYGYTSQKKSLYVPDDSVNGLS